jgi:RNase P subunit RPR2
MKEKISRQEAKERITGFFEQDELDPEDVRKIKGLAMKFNIKLGEHRKRFCKKCLSDLKDSKTRGKDGMKSIECKKCGYLNRWKIKD